MSSATKLNPPGKKAARMSSAEQHKAFVEAAGAADADGEESTADALMGRLAKTKPDPKPKAIKSEVQEA